MILIQSLIACHSVRPMQSKSAGRLSILPAASQDSDDYYDIGQDDLEEDDLNDEDSGEANFDFEEPFLQIISHIRDSRLCSPKVFNNVFENRSNAVELRKNRDYTRFCIEERLKQSNMSQANVTVMGHAIPKVIRNKVPVSAAVLKKIMKNLPKCQPRKEYVQLGIPGEDISGISYFPSCVLVKRCSSCDAHINLMSSCGQNKVCLPSKIRRKRVKVLALKQDHDGTLTLRDDPVATINVQEHTRCQCQCQSTSNDCSPNEVFDSHQCRCRCRDEASLAGKCGRERFWHRPSCSCRCKNLPPNLDDSCTTNWKFNLTTCQCERI